MTTNTASEIAVTAHKHAEMACAAYKIELPESKKMRMFVPQYNHIYTSEFNRMMNELIESNS